MEPQASDDEHEWIKVARKEIGVREYPGPKDNPRVVEYIKATSITPTMWHDETPWCASFVCWCLEQVGIRSTRRANARSYLDFGREITTPEPGCIAVFARGDHPAQGHVGFVVGVESDGDLQILGGNQANRVCIELQPRSRLLGLRMPAP